MKKLNRSALLAPLVAALLGVTAVSEAQIFINLGANPPYTFQETPPATEWATSAAGVGTGGAGGYGTPATVDAGAQTVNQSTITEALGTTADNAANASARHNNVDGFLVTRSTSVAATVLKAHLRNNSGAVVSSLTIAYDFGVIPPASTTESAFGHRVFWSRTGLPNSWTLIPQFSGLNVSTSVTATINLGAWVQNADLYLLWLDDNGATNPDGIYSIDNFAVTAVEGQISPISITGQPANTNVAERGSATFTVTATGEPKDYYWFRRNVGETTFSPIATAANAPSFSVGPVVFPGDNGSQFQVVVSNVLGAVTSSVATLTVQQDLTAPTVVRAVGLQNPEYVEIVFSENMDENTITGGSNFRIFERSNPSGSYSTYEGYLTNGNTVVIRTDARTAGVNYDLEILDVRDASSGNNTINPNPTIVGVRPTIELIGLDANNEWKWFVGGELFGQFEQVGFDDSSWQSGPAPLGVDTTVSGSQPPIRTQTSYTANSAPSYFRRTFFLPSNPGDVTLQMRHFFEDGGIVYINGQEAIRINAPAGPLTAASRAPAGLAEGSGVAGPVTLPATNLVAGVNHIAVAVIQNGGTSSDSVMTLELTASLPGFASGAPNITTDPVSQTVNEGNSATFSVAVEGAVQGMTFQWRRNGTDIAGATNRTYTIQEARPVAHGGSYTVFVQNDEGTDLSAAATLNVIPDTSRPTLFGVNVDSNRTSLTLSFSERLSTANGENAANYTLQQIGGDAVTITNAVQQGTNIVLGLANAVVDGASYNITFNGVTDRAESANPVTPSTVGIASLVSFSGSQAWRYNQEGVDLGTAWYAPAYNDNSAGWSNGLAVFDVLRDTPRETVGGELVRTVLSLTNAQAGGTSNTLVFYFRTHFNWNLPSNNVPLRINHLIDDGAVFYLNGTEAYRFNMGTNEQITYTNLATSVGTASRQGSFAVNNASLQNGDNVLAVQLHQTSLTSSDVTLGVDLYALVPGGLPNVAQKRLTITRGPGANQVTISWTGGGVLQATDDLLNSATGWQDVPGNPSSPFTTTATAAKRFYRLR
jgi:hypothetical protein